MVNQSASEFSHLPDFTGMDIAAVEFRLAGILNGNRAEIIKLTQIEKPDWQNFVYRMDLLADELERFWSPVRHLNSVMNSPQIRKTYNAGLKLISEYSTDLGQNQDLYKQYLKLKESSNFTSLEPGQRKAVEDSLRSFRLGGVSLPEDKKERFKQIALKLSELTTQFAENVLDSTNAWSKHIENKQELEGLPGHAIKAAELRAREKNLGGYLLNLEFPTYYAVQTFADQRELRKELYYAYTSRASDQGPHDRKYDNREIINIILNLRSEQAQLLGFENYAELSIESKMVESPDRVKDFLQQLIDRSKPGATAEIEELKKFAEKSGLEGELQAWDVSYYSNKLKQASYRISDDDLKPYFPATKVIPGMFDVVKRLFGLQIERLMDVDVWHEDVHFYRIKDSTGNTRGGFYLDIYARDNKRGGAWMDECISRMRISDRLNLPVAYLTCNLTPPVGDEPALLTHNEVITLFHEFGHGLHHMLTRVDFRDVSGINGVEWDAVELPSQFLENWCWEKEALDLLSEHYQTGETIPSDLLDRARRAKNFQSAMLMLRQIEFALFDIRLHLESRPDLQIDVQQLLDEVRAEVAVLPVPQFNRFQNSFTHIFSGGYAAGYFSYKWAEVLSADAYSRFEEEGIFNPDTGKDFLRKILEKGGTQKALELFVDFRGREPRIDALLRHSGLLAV